MAVQDWSITPDSNTNIDGVDIAENCPAANVNNALRRIMASVKVLYNTLPNQAGTTVSFLPRSGGSMIGQIVKQNGGGYLYSAAAGNPGGAVYYIPVGGAVPTGLVNGDWVVELQ